MVECRKETVVEDEIAKFIGPWRVTGWRLILDQCAHLNFKQMAQLPKADEYFRASKIDTLLKMSLYDMKSEE
jgi:hypothetical protein